MAEAQSYQAKGGNASEEDQRLGKQRERGERKEGKGKHESHG
jgi:hypothetical protein